VDGAADGIVKAGEVVLPGLGREAVDLRVEEEEAEVFVKVGSSSFI
jgi:hypothetical protein